MKEKKQFTYNDERFADLQLLRYCVEGFETLSLRQKKLVYHLSEAALWGRDILWDQNCKYNLGIRRMLEAVYTKYNGNRECQQFQDFVTYLKRVWFSNGIHHHYGCDKFLPEFDEAYLRHLLQEINYPADEELIQVITDPTVMAKRVNQAEGEDLVATSACNYYGDGVTQQMAEDFYGSMKDKNDPRPVMYGMNSQLVQENGVPREVVWKADGMYGNAIRHIIECLEAAIGEAENEKQQQVIRTLIDFYRTGDLHTFDQYTIQWVEETEGEVDFTNGFTESYGDPLGMKASWEGYVNFVNHEATERTRKLSENAQWFEDHSPVAPQFKKKECRGVSAKVIVAAMLGGDLYPSSAIGINLPNSNWVRAVYGSKSVTIGNLTEAYSKAARGNGFREEFVVDDETMKLLEKYDDACDDLHTDLHECLGHGSGQLLPGVDADALKAYGSTIEEARADLFGLYYIADPKLTEMGLTPDGEAYKAQYYSYMMNGLLTQLVRIEPGNQIEEAHMRNRALIAHWCMAQGNAMEMVAKDGKHYLRINDYAALRGYIATLLAEIQRIKSEGDYEAARQLVELYAIKVDQDLHREVLERYRALNLAPYKGFINPQYTVERNADGSIADIKIEYGEAYDHQMLRYSREYATL